MKKKRESGFRNGVRTLILKDSRGFIPFDGRDNIFTYYASYSFLSRATRRVFKNLKSGFVPSVFYGEWKKHLKNAAVVILFDCGVENANVVARYIKSVNPSVRVVFWYWNTVKPGHVIQERDCIDEVWTYNRFDAKKYGFKYNPQFYHKDLVIKNNKTYLDMVFLGTDKGRKRVLENLANEAKKQGLKCDFVLVKTKKDNMPYKDYLKKVANSRCIIDLVPRQDCGLTLRPLEALFFGKKLLTNYKDIANYDFYDKANVFILGKDNTEYLEDFINSPYKEIKSDIIDYYSYESWLERIEKNESTKYE